MNGNVDCKSRISVWALYTLIAMFPVAGAGCGGIDIGLDRFGTSVDDTATKSGAVIDSAILDLTGQSVAWQDVLKETATELDAISHDYSLEISAILDRSIATVGQVAQCVADHIVDQLIFQLRALKAKILGQSAPNTEPKICSVAPPFLESDAIANGKQPVVTLYGYFLEGPFRVELQPGLGGPKDITELLSKTSEYQLVLKTSSGAEPVVTSDYQRVALLWNGAAVSEIPIVQPTSPTCVRSERHVEAKTIDIPTNRRTVGDADADWAGNGPEVFLSVLGFPWTKVAVVASIEAYEDGGDQTAVTGGTTVSLYNIPSGYHIVGPTPILDGTGGAGTLLLRDDQSFFADGIHDVRKIAGAPDSIVDFYEVRGIGSAGNAADYTSVKVQFRPFIIVLSGPPEGHTSCK